MTQLKLYNKALTYLANREYSRLELAQKLEKNGDDVNLIQQVLDQLVQQNLLSDERFAEQYVRIRANRGFGPQRIKQELKQRGISVELVAQSLQQDQIDWYKQMQRAWQKRFKTLPKDLQERAKQVRFLLYKGFTSEQVNELLS